MGLVAGLLLLVGCEAQNQVQVRQPMMVRLSPYDSVAVSTSAISPEGGAFAAELNGRLLELLRGSVLFLDVESTPEVGDHVPKGRLNLLVEVTDVRAVDSTLRYYAGVLAGPAEAKAVATVYDARSGMEIGSAQFDAQSANDSVYTGTTEQVLDQLARQVVGWLAQYK